MYPEVISSRILVLVYLEQRSLVCTITINGTITIINATIINGGGLDVTQAPEYWCI